MDKQKYIDKIDALLHDLEGRGEIVITSVIPQYISKAIFHSIVEEMLSREEESEFIIECDIPYLLEQMASHISSVFGEEIESAKGIVNNFYHMQLERLTMQQVAELIHHETPFEIALLAYYCCKLGKSGFRDLKYLDWRKKYYAKC
jgi:hypothetical protein